ncbi:hypothetical protein AQUCO_05700053v1 [Aquilegia coerulea]|uniref:FBD domain-containing protein n=1 Tax=Aquilegia coerulea TaxID=218851 RepID=A0A2G5CFL5_AQUCA|nr:hypothetical protein AQUCO_05700053v1 [Aquilegia coerulea]
MCGEHGGICKSPCNIIICTPNLTSIKFRAYFYDNFLLENLDSLGSATIEFADRWRVRHLINVLKGLHNVTTLELFHWEYEIKPMESQAILIQLSRTFHNLRSLMLLGWRSSFLIYVITTLLKSSPFLETLVLSEVQVLTKGYIYTEL